MFGENKRQQVLPHNPSREKASKFNICFIIPKRTYVLLALLIVYIIISIQFFVMDVAMEKLLKDELVEYMKTFQWRVEAAYFLGFLILPLISGLYVTKTGKCKEAISFGIIFSSIATLLTPSIFEISLNSAIFVRSMVGMGHAIAFGASFPLIYFWFPKQEYIRCIATLLSGYIGGDILSNFYAVNLTDEVWKSFFNWYGTLPLFCGIMFYYNIVNHPSQHPSVSQSEIFYLRNNGSPHSFPPPVLSIKKELSENTGVLLYIITQSLFLFAGSSYLSIVPFFMVETVGSEYAFFSLLFFVLFTVVFAMIIDFLINRIAMKNVREAVSILGLIGSALTIRYFCTINHLEYVRLAALFFSYSFLVSSYPGHCSSILEISPRISGFVIGICLQFMVVGGMIAFPGMRYALDVSGAWSIVFNLISFAEIVGALAWIAYAYLEHKKAKWTPGNILRE